MEYPKQEFGMVVAIISETIFKRMYEIGTDHDVYYTGCAEKIAEWAEEFVEANKDVNWEDLLFDKAVRLPLSTEWEREYSKTVEEWDSAIIDFALSKLEAFREELGLPQEEHKLKEKEPEVVTFYQPFDIEPHEKKHDMKNTLKYITDRVYDLTQEIDQKGFENSPTEVALRKELVEVGNKIIDEQK